MLVPVKRLALLSLFATSLPMRGAVLAALAPFLENHCVECHDAENKKGGLNLDALPFDLSDAKSFSTWVKVHDRTAEHEMPPKKKERPKAEAADAFLGNLSAALVSADAERAAREGRASWRRLNRYEYENSVRDLLGAPWLELKVMLPEDGEAFRFNKVSDALDVSHVQMARYLGAADFALRGVMAQQVEAPEAKVTRYYARDQGAMAGKSKLGEFNRSAERATFPMIDSNADIPVLEDKAPMTAGEADPEKRELEALGVVASSYEPIEIKFNNFRAPSAGRYKLRFSAYTFWAAPESEKAWWKPDRKNLSDGRTREPVSIYAAATPHLLRKLGAFDVTPNPSEQELEVWLLAGETIQPDAARLFRSRPGNPGGWHNPLAERDGQPGVAFRWMEVEGPIIDQWPTPGQRLLFGDLPLKMSGKRVEVVPNDAKADAPRLLKAFLDRAYRRPVIDADVQRFLSVIEKAQMTGSSFAESMIAGYSAVLCSPGFICREEKAGALDDFAMASRLAYFLWNSPPDESLRAAAAAGELRRPEVLRVQTERLLADARSRRFVNAFLDYWLDLRKAEATSPDATLYPDYYLDDLLVESAVEETQQFFTELVKANLPSRNLVASDFAMLNERLAEHYGLPTNAKVADVSGEGDESPGELKSLVDGVAIRRVKLPPESPRGGLMTQASVLKVTANGTTTSPVLRGAWIMERILGKAPPPPPASVPAIEPDTRGATTIREQLEKHRSQESCALCHEKIDPAGFALENFDVLGGWRERYRALGEGEKEKGFGKNGNAFVFHLAQPVDPSGTLPGGGDFKDIHELKKLLLKDERQIARNLAKQLIVFATGAPVRFGDRAALEQILDRASASDFAVRNVIHEIVQSPLFQNK